MRRSVLLSFLLILGCRSQRPIQPPLSPAVFTPDNTGIVFAVAHGPRCFLYRADIASGAMKRVTNAADACEANPQFSPDGRHLAYVSAPSKGTHAAVMVANADGSGSRELVPADADNLQPAFVPQSSYVLFVRSAAFEHHSPLVDNRRHKFDLFSVNTKTGEVKQQTDEKFYELSHLSVSADGRHAMITVSTYPEGDQFQILPVNDAKRTKEVIQPQVRSSGENSQPVLYSGAWMPDGKSIVFMAARTPPGGGNFDYNVYRYTLSSKQIEQLTDLKGMLEGFSISNDGEKAVLLHQGDFLVLDLSKRQIQKVPLQW